MKAITLTQPWATLVAIGAKQVETRSWATSYRGPLAIHAAKGLKSVGGYKGLADLVDSEPFFRAFVQHGLAQRHSDPEDIIQELPMGAIVAMCVLVDCVHAAHWAHYHGISDQERAFGDYADGRYAWLLADIKPLPEPIPAKGALGLWEPDTLTQMAIKRQQIAAIDDRR